LRTFAALVIMAALAACSGDPSGSRDSPVARESPESVAPAGPPPKAVTLADLNASKIAVPGAPDWMADDGARLYVKTDSGSVAVIDPSTTKEVRRLPLGPGGLCQGIGVAGGAIWSCSPNDSGTGDDVLRVNPRSGKVDRYEVSKRPDQGHLDAAGGRVCVITDNGLVGLAVQTGQPDPPVDLGVPGTDLAATSDRAYVVSRGSDAVVEVDLKERRVVAQSSVAGAWVMTGGDVAALEKTQLKETARIHIDGTPCDVSAEGNRVFVRGTQPMLTEVDAATHRVSRVIIDASSECGAIHVALVRSG
jgi:hypothetical protein